MTQNAQISRESVANIGQIVENAVKPLKGKYDGRGKWKRNNYEYRDRAKPGPKSLRTQHLSQTKANKVLAAFDLIASQSQIYAWLWEKKQVVPMLQMRENAENRAFGKPFTAENPAISKQSAALAQDNRLQVAIQNLVLTPGAKRTASKGKKIKQLAAPTPTLDATTTDASTDLDASTLP